jgi:hypothetical protein
MDMTEKNLYKAITSGNYSEANKILEGLLEVASGERIITVLKSTEEK